MAKMSASEEIGVPADRLWALVGRWDRFEEIAGEVVRECVLERGGRCRRLYLDDGVEIEEPLLEYDHARRTIVWGIGECRNFDPPIRTETFAARFTVRDADRGQSSHLDIEWTYDVKPDRAAEGEALLRDYFRICFAGTRAALGL